jgi:biopolymer transport protein ExbD
MLLGGGCTTSRSGQGATVQVIVESSGALSVQGHSATITGLEQTFAKLSVPADSSILIQADRRVAHKHIRALMDELKDLGHSDIMFQVIE